MCFFKDILIVVRKIIKMYILYKINNSFFDNYWSIFKRMYGFYIINCVKLYDKILNIFKKRFSLFLEV